MKKIQCLLPLLLITVNVVMGQHKQDQITSEDIIITGETIDSAIINDPGKKQDLMIHSSSYASYFLSAPTITNDFKIGFKSNFEVILPGKTRYMYVDFGLQPARGLVEFNNVDNTYILEKGDRIHCRLSQKYYQFSGRGSEKLNCQSEIYALIYTPNENELAHLFNKKYKDFFWLSNKRRDSLFLLQVDVVNKYSSILGRKMAGVMLANVYGNRYFTMLRSDYSKYKSSPTEFLELRNHEGYIEAYKAIDLSLNQKLDEETLIASPVYSNFLIEKIIGDNLTNGKGNVTTAQSMLQELVFNDIKNSYKGLMREKLLTLFFYRFRNTDLNFLNQALLLCQDKEFRDCLLKIKKVKGRGSDFFPFELQDTKGKIVKLSDFNDKIVILDFWYEGCINCAFLHEGLRPLVAKYKNNPKVEFVSISIDINKSSWIKCIAQDKYTDPDRVNLYTNGLGKKHPVIDANEIKGYPAIFVLKNGKVFSASPPRPGLPITSSSSIAARTEFISLIEEALAEKKVEENKSGS